MDTDTLAVEWVSPDSLHLNPANPRRNDEAVPHVAASLQRFGWRQPLVVRADGEVIAGNTRLKAALSLGHETVPVVRFEGSDLEATAYGIADNRTAEFAEWDDAALADILRQLQAEDALDGVGYTDEELDALVADLAAQSHVPAELDDPGPGEPPEQPVARQGDTWLLGEHRLMCGDSTSPHDVAALMQGSQAALVATDPPYLIDYTGERPNNSGKDWTDTFREIDIGDPEGFFRATFTNVLEVLAPHAAIYCWHAHKRVGLIQRIWEELGILDHQEIIWVKPASVFGRVYWHFRHEPCVMGWRKGSQPPHTGEHDHDSVWEVDWNGKARIQADHPTCKPVELFARPMRKHTRPGDVVFEPFSGSGSQLIAAEELGRVCRAMENAPAYVDVAVKRWQVATGEQATLEATGESFAAVGAERMAARASEPALTATRTSGPGAAHAPAPAPTAAPKPEPAP